MFLYVSYFTCKLDLLYLLWEPIVFKFHVIFNKIYYSQTYKPSQLLNQQLFITGNSMSKLLWFSCFVYFFVITNGIVNNKTIKTRYPTHQLLCIVKKSISETFLNMSFVQYSPFMLMKTRDFISFWTLYQLNKKICVQFRLPNHICWCALKNFYALVLWSVTYPFYCDFTSIALNPRIF